jgi:hypothetical protein
MKAFVFPVEREDEVRAAIARLESLLGGNIVYYADDPGETTFTVMTADGKDTWERVCYLRDWEKRESAE